jgi:hypothetical protein
MKGAMQRLCWLVALQLVLGVPALSSAQLKAIATIETNMKATGEIYECKRKQGVLTIKVRFKAAGGRAELDLPYDTTYVVDVASGKKYTILRDSDKAPLATTSQGWGDRVRESVEPGATFSAWWKFPAPPPTTKKISFILPKSEPAEDVPITDAP